MDRRKTIELGKSTLVVSLPSTWVKKVGLKGGEYLNLEEGKEGNLYLSPPDSKIETYIKKFEVPESFTKNAVRKLVETAYCAGYDYLELSCTDSNKLTRTVQETVKNLNRMELVSQTGNSFLIKDIGEKQQEGAVQILQNSCLLLNCMNRDSLEAFNLDKKEFFDELTFRKQSIEKSCMHGIRVLNKSKFRQEHSLLFFEIFKLVENLTSIYFSIFGIVHEIKDQKTKKEISGIWAQINLFVENFLKNCCDKNLDNLLLQTAKKDIIEKNIERLIATTKDAGFLKIMLWFSAIIGCLDKIILTNLMIED